MGRGSGVILAIAAVGAAGIGLAVRAGGVVALPDLREPWPTILGLTVGIAAALALAAAITRQGLRRLADRVRAQAAAERPERIVAGGILADLADAISQLVAARASAEESLRVESRQLHIRHRVAETERRQAEAVMHALRDGVIVTDLFDEILVANESAGRALGFDRATALHRPLAEVVSDRELCHLVAEVRETAAPGMRRQVEHVVRGTDPAGNAIETTFDVRLSCIADGRGEVGGVIAILHDLTRERELARMKTDFVAKASHELRTPLTSIRAYVEMLVDGEAGDEDARREFYRIIQHETERLSRLIDNMLNISRIEAGIVQIERTNVDMRMVVRDAIETLQPQAQEKSIALASRTSDVDLCVEGDRDMLLQVMLNLVSNAVKYTPKGGRVTVAADTDNLTRSVVVSVSDTGLGIPPDARDRIFEKFYRIENYQRIAKGTGLGLNLCKHIVETVHGGTIDVESQLGMGSKFTFSVPMRHASARPAA